MRRALVTVPLKCTMDKIGDSLQNGRAANHQRSIIVAEEPEDRENLNDDYERSSEQV